MKLITTLVIVLILAGCENETVIKRNEQRYTLLVKAWQSCIDAGGVPIQSAWLSAPIMDRCEFPPLKESKT